MVPRVGHLAVADPDDGLARAPPARGRGAAPDRRPRCRRCPPARTRAARPRSARTHAFGTPVEPGACEYPSTNAPGARTSSPRAPRSRATSSRTGRRPRRRPPRRARSTRRPAARDRSTRRRAGRTRRPCAAARGAGVRAARAPRRSRHDGAIEHAAARSAPSVLVGRRASARPSQAGGRADGVCAMIAREARACAPRTRRAGRVVGRRRGERAVVDTARARATGARARAPGTPLPSRASTRRTPATRSRERCGPRDGGGEADELAQLPALGQPRPVQPLGAVAQLGRGRSPTAQAAG